ncbi:ribonuclease III domain-containing protein [Pisolithus marmoratus]|nr:ribonuclease III domain-containing protein [Pisolithus marmoratus]
MAGQTMFLKIIQEILALTMRMWCISIRYEHLGDSVLGLVVTKVLADNYPLLHVGPSTKLCSLVVSNATLANISCQYGLHHHLRLHAAQEVTLRASLNIQADVFESYVGGLYWDQGLPVVETWLKALFIPYIKDAYCHVRAQHGLPPVPLPDNNLTTCVDSSDMEVGGITSQGANEEWVYTNGPGDGIVTTPIWSVKAEVNGEVYGKGMGRTKKAARNEAAKEGLKKLGINIEDNRDSYPAVGLC